jgi:hypothetical protein
VDLAVENLNPQKFRNGKNFGKESDKFLNSIETGSPKSLFPQMKDKFNKPFLLLIK